MNYYHLSDSFHVRISLFKKRVNYEEDKSLQCAYFFTYFSLLGWQGQDDGEALSDPQEVGDHKQP